MVFIMVALPATHMPLRVFDLQEGVHHHIKKKWICVRTVFVLEKFQKLVGGLDKTWFVSFGIWEGLCHLHAPRSSAYNYVGVLKLL